MSSFAQLPVRPRWIGLDPYKILPPTAHGWDLYAALVELRPPGGWCQDETKFVQVIDWLRDEETAR
jgi:hypothetical protein